MASNRINISLLLTETFGKKAIPIIHKNAVFKPVYKHVFVLIDSDMKVLFILNGSIQYSHGENT